MSIWFRFPADVRTVSAFTLIGWKRLVPFHFIASEETAWTIQNELRTLLYYCWQRNYDNHSNNCWPRNACPFDLRICCAEPARPLFRQDVAYSHGLVSVSVCVCLCVSVKSFAYIGQTLAKITNVKIYVCRFWHLPSYGVIAKIAFRDLDLLVVGQTFIFSVSETIRTSKKICDRHL